MQNLKAYNKTGISPIKAIPLLFSTGANSHGFSYDFADQALGFYQQYSYSFSSSLILSFFSFLPAIVIPPVIRGYIGGITSGLIIEPNSAFPSS